MCVCNINSLLSNGKFIIHRNKMMSCMIHSMHNKYILTLTSQINLVTMSGPYFFNI